MSETPMFDAIKEEQGVSDTIFLPFKSHKEFLAEHEHDEWLALVLTLLDDQQMHKPDREENADDLQPAASDSDPTPADAPA